MAVYTEVSDIELADFVKQYDIGSALSYKGIAEGVENTNYVLITEHGSYILTLYEKRVDAQDLPFFLGLMEHLAHRGVPCPTPIHGRDGEVLRQLCGRPAAVTSFLSGIWPRKSEFFHCQALGRALAQLHLAGRDYLNTRTNALSVGSWRPLFEKCRVEAEAIMPGSVGEIEAELSELENQWPPHLPSGVIHADLFPDNVFFDDSRLSGLIDFYFACNDALAYDLAICLNAWCFEADFSFNIIKARSLIEGYRESRDCSQAEMDALPLLARGAALRFLLTRLYDWINQVDGALVKPKNPGEYLQILRFHQKVSGPIEYGIGS